MVRLPQLLHKWNLEKSSIACVESSKASGTGEGVLRPHQDRDNVRKLWLAPLEIISYAVRVRRENEGKGRLASPLCPALLPLSPSWSNQGSRCGKELFTPVEALGRNSQPNRPCNYTLSTFHASS